MSGRTSVLIFFFWSVIIIVTPMLLLLSESSKPHMDFQVEKNGVKVRKTMDYTQKHGRVEEPVEGPTPASTPEPVILEITKDHLISFLEGNELGD